MTTKQTIGYEEIIAYAQRILDGGEITPKEAEELIHVSDEDTMILLAMADKIRQKFSGNEVDLCAIVNARSGKCLKTVNSAPNRLITKQALPYIRL